MSYIKVNGQYSADLGLQLLRGFDRTSAENDVSEIEILGRDGVVTVDNNRKKNIDRTYYFTARDDDEIIHLEEKLTEWLDFAGYQEMELGWDDEYLYEARLIRPFNPKELFANFSYFSLDFRFQPYKFLKKGMQEIQVSNGQTIKNIGTKIASPLVKLVGTAPSMILTINGRKTEFKNVQDGIVIDTHRRLVYWDNNAKWDNFVRWGNDDFPTLDIGDNLIEFTGADSMSMIPRWVVSL